MIKRTLIAMAVVALLATVTHAAWVEDPFTDYNLGWPNGGDQTALKVDGKDNFNMDFRWPYEISISYKPLVVCTIPVKMQVGMYVQIDKCKDKKILLVQKSCGDLEIDPAKYPCYQGCVDLNVRSNFEVKMGAVFHQSGDILDNGNVSAYYDGGNDVVAGDGDYHTVTLCLKAWSAKIYKATPGDEVSVGSVDVTVKPNI